MFRTIVDTRLTLARKAREQLGPAEIGDVPAALRFKGRPHMLVFVLREPDRNQTISFDSVIQGMDLCRQGSLVCTIWTRCGEVSERARNHTRVDFGCDRSLDQADR